MGEEKLACGRAVGSRSCATVAVAVVEWLTVVGASVMEAAVEQELDPTVVVAGASVMEAAVEQELDPTASLPTSA